MNHKTLFIYSLFYVHSHYCVVHDQYSSGTGRPLASFIVPLCVVRWAGALSGSSCRPHIRSRRRLFIEGRPPFGWLDGLCGLAPGWMADRRSSGGGHSIPPPLHLDQTPPGLGWGGDRHRPATGMRMRSKKAISLPVPSPPLLL